MPTSNTFSVIYLGHSTTMIDPTEGVVGTGNYIAENAALLDGQTFTNFTNASVQTFAPGDPDVGSRYDQDASIDLDSFTITDGSGATSVHVFDAVARYNGTVTYSDGTTTNVVLMIIQDDAGNLYACPPAPGSVYTDPLIAALTAKPITAITLNTVEQNDLSGLGSSREVLQIVTVPCFVRGTLIRTVAGDVPVETLSPGDLVITRDCGAQPIRWIGSRQLDAAELRASPHLRPIRIRRGALGQDLPAQDLLVSPQHRVLVRSAIAQRMFGTGEVLVAAKALIQAEGIDVEETDQVQYFHLMFDRHQIVFSNGAETESFYAGPMALEGVDDAAREELFTLFPELRGEQLPEPARLLVTGRLGRKLALRHIQNRKPLQVD